MSPTTLSTQHDPWLVLGAFLIACLASYVTLDLERRVRAANGLWARGWQVGGSLVMGSGVWAMHFVAMLGFDAGIPLGYAPGLTVLSWLAAVAAAGVALGLAARQQPGRGALATGIVAMAAGVCAMHYIGMAALDIAPGILWRWGWVAASVLAALAAPAAAVAIVAGLRRVAGPARRPVQLGAALAMGLGICVMHFLGMQAAELPAGAVCRSVDGLGGGGLAVAVTVTALLLLGITLATSALDARAQARERRLASSLQVAQDRLQDANAELQRMAFQDGLTGLPNRALFEDRLQHAVARLECRLPPAGQAWPQRPGARLAVLLVDLDGFKPINDSYGHAVGDELLRQVATRLQTASRPGDTLARIGGDEFVVLLEDLDGSAAAAVAAQQLLRALDHVFVLGARSVRLSCSVGWALHPEHGGAERLLACADAAVQAAKRGGGHQAVMYEPAMAGDAAQQVSLAQALRGAAERGELSLHYQPKVRGDDGRVHGVEALLRWRHPGRGMVSPALFVPVAERFGLIGPIGRWVIDEACAQLARWAREGRRIHLAINLSAHQLRQRDLARHVRQALDRHGLDPRLLVCEVTETAMMENLDAQRAVLDELGAMGVRISIDDFGTGYSSLAYLRRLPARQLKIDRSLVADIEREPDALAVLDAVVRLAHALRLEVVAEGVETPGQLGLLQALGCDLIQGWVIARAMPADELMAWLTQREPLPAGPAPDAGARAGIASPA